MTRSAEYDDRTDEAPQTRALPLTGGPVLEPNEARQGATHHNMRYVLGFGLAGAIVLLALTYLSFAGSVPAPL